MDEKRGTHDDAANASEQAAEPKKLRQWDPPTFERLRLKDTMSGSPNQTSFDGTLYYS